LISEKGSFETNPISFSIQTSEALSKDGQFLKKIKIIPLNIQNFLMVGWLFSKISRMGMIVFYGQ
jgi:hypothetical protein